MLFKKVIFTLSIVVLTIHTVLAQGELTKVGTTAANFLQMEVGAKAIAMGGAYVAVANDATALYWNPAGISLLNSTNVHYQIKNLYADIQHHFSAISIPVSAEDRLGVMVNYLDIGNMEITTIEEPEGTGQNFDASNLSMGVGYARRLTDRVHVGITGKLIQERIWLETASGFAFDVGTMYDIKESGLRIGMSLNNLGPDMGIDEGPHLGFYKEKQNEYPGSPTPESQLKTKKFPLPLVFNMGISLQLMGKNSLVQPAENQSVVLALGANDSFDTPFRTNWGIEYLWRNMFAVRAGIHQGYDTAKYAAGIGLNFQEITNLDFVIDYAWSDYGDLDSISLWSVEFRF